MRAYSTAYRWNIVLLLGFSQAIAYIDRVNLSVVGPDLIHTHHYSPTLVGVLFSTFNWAFTLSLLLAGPFTDKVRARIAFPAGVGLWSIATALCSTTTLFAPLAVFRAMVGMGESPMIPSGSRVIRETFPRENRALVVGTFFAGNKIGLTLGIPLASTLFALFGWPAVFYVTGSLGLVWLVWWIAVYRKPEDMDVARVPHDMDVARVPHDIDVAPEPAAARIRWATLLRYRTTWGLMLGQAGYLYIFYVFANWLPGYLVLQRHMSILNSGMVGMLPFLVSTLCTIAAGWMGDRLIRAGWRVTRVRKGFAVGGLLSATIFTIAGAYAVDTVLAISCLTIAVGSFSCSTAAVNSMPIDVAPPHIVSSLVSLQNFGGNVGGSFAPWVTGLLLQMTGDFQAPLLVTAAVALVFGCGSYGLVVGNLDRTLR